MRRVAVLALPVALSLGLVESGIAGPFGLTMDTQLRMQAWHDSPSIGECTGEIDVKQFNPAGP